MKHLNSIRAHTVNMSHLSVPTWNIQGLIGTTFNKLHESSVITEIQKHHVIGLTETHTLPEDNIFLPGYHAYHICRQKSLQKRHGGIAFLVRDEIREGVKFYPSDSKDIAWAILKKEFFGLDKDIYIGLVYFSPANSSYATRLEYNPFDKLMGEIEKYSNTGNLIVMGDFNARSSNLSDLLNSNRCDHIPSMSVLDYDDNFHERFSQDSGKRVCQYGNNLIDLCISTGMEIANGRILGDLTGKFTCHKYNGSSVVDYVLADNIVLSHLQYLRVNDFIGDISDHCLISFGIAVRATVQESKEEGSPLPKKLRWQEKAAPLIRGALIQDPQLDQLAQGQVTYINEEVKNINELHQNQKCIQVPGKDWA